MEKRVGIAKRFRGTKQIKAGGPRGIERRQGLLRNGWGKTSREKKSLVSREIQRGKWA